MAEMNNACVGQAIGWNAGAEFLIMEQTPSPISGLGYAPYSMGNSGNTYYGAPMVDAKGKEIPWVDKNGKELKEFKERFRPARDHKFMLGEGIGLFSSYHLTSNRLTGDLPERLFKGELKLPFYADLTRMPENERRVIFGMMVGNESKTRIPIYDTYTKAGFDPDKDMLQAPIMHPNEYRRGIGWAGRSFAHMRGIAGGGFLVDWDLRTSMEGLYAAGKCIFGSGNHGFASTTGRYAGMRAAEYAMTAPDPVIHRRQVEVEKGRIYAPLKHDKKSIGWKELKAGLCKVMQDYCGEYKSEKTLKMGLEWLQSIRESEAASVYARNPHELARSLECLTHLTLGEMVFHTALGRLAEKSTAINHTIRLKKGEVSLGEQSFRWWLKSPYASTYAENYSKHYAP